MHTSRRPLPWRPRRTTVAVATALAIGAQTLFMTGAQADSPTPPRTSDEAAAHVASTGILDKYLAAKDAEPSAAVKALAEAKKSGKRVEVAKKTSSTSRTWANPDGTLTSELTAGPARMKRDGDWVDVDVTLKSTANGVTPQAHPKGLRLSGGGGTVAGSLASAQDAPARDLVTLGEGAEQVTLQWKGGLPAPELDGTQARYREALPDADVIVEATRTGFEQFVELAKRPGGAYSYTLPLQVEGLKAKAAEDGSVTFTDEESGEVRATMPAPVMWDASTDPVSGERTNQAAVDMKVVDHGSGRFDLVVTPDEKFLADPDTVYPVTVDPSTSALSNTFDTYVQQGETRDWSTDTELDFGNPGTTNADGTPRTARSFISWNTTPIQDALITKADVSLWNFHSGNTDCSAQGWDIWDTGAPSTASRWTSQPPWNQKFHSATQTKGNPGCTNAPDGWISSDVTTLVQTWASAKAAKGHMGLRAASDDVKAWKRVNSANNAANPPKLTVTYNYRPMDATDLKAGPPYSVKDGAWIASSTTPTLRATIADADSDKVNGTFEIRDKATKTRVGNLLVSDWTPSGEPTSVKVPSGLLKNGTQYEFRVSGYDGTHYSIGWSNWASFTVNEAYGATLTRIAGSDPVETAVKVSQDHWRAANATTGNAADAVVLAPAATHQDAVAGIPLAKAKKGPLLLSGTAALDAQTSSEIKRILPAGRTVHLVGGTLSADVEQSLRAAGYQVVRHSGATSQATSLAVARDGITAPKHVTIASASSWKDALSAASAVAAADGAVILSNGKDLDAATKAWLDALPDKVTVTTVGGPARDAYPSTDGTVVGADSIETSAFIADKFMPAPKRVGLTSSADFSHGLGAGAYAASNGMPLLLNSPTKFDQGGKWFAEDHSATVANLTLFGGPTALSDAVGNTARQAATETFIDGEIVPAGEAPGTREEANRYAIEPDWAGETPATRGYPGGMNDEEFHFCKWPSRWSICKDAFDTAATAKAIAEREKSADGMWPGSSGNGGKADAYRHCSWNALMAYKMGSKTAKGFGDRHELGPKPPNMTEAEAERHHKMDYYNNARGRFFGQYARDAGMPAYEAYVQTTGWCLLSVNDGLLTTMKY